MYTADQTFVKELKAIDRRLDCTFDNKIGKFKITYPQVIGDRVPVMWVETEQKGFRFPDRRDIANLWRSDTHRDQVRQALNMASYTLEKMNEEKKRKQREEIKDRTKDDKIQLANKFSRLEGAGKNNSAFRRIEAKTKGVKIKH